MSEREKDTVTTDEECEINFREVAARPLRIADLDADDKPREKAQKHGIAILTDAELLAIVIGSGLPGVPVTDLSRNILAATSNKLSNLSRLSIQQLSNSVRGIGPAKAVGIAAAFELGRRCAAETPDEQPQIKQASDIDAYMRRYTRLEYLEHEEFWVLFLSRANKVKEAYRVSQGGTAATVVDIKMVMKAAVDRLAEAMILVHNHPSGNLNPSMQDIELTRKIKEACKVFDIRLLDHIIIAGKEYYSFLDKGKL